MLLPAARVARCASPDPQGAAEPDLVDAAIAFLTRRYVQHGRTIVYNPVSLLQREFALGYRAGCELAMALEVARVWQLARMADSQFATVISDATVFKQYKSFMPSRDC
jgi:hypothetical protein